MRCATAGPRAGRRACCWAAAASASELRIEVKDNGPGIAADKQAIIFDEFVRLQAEDDAPREERGLGLGLAIVDRIARMLDLPVGLASAPGRGSTFSVTVPRVAAVVAAPVAPPAPQPTPSVEAESFVLCIDNEARVREAMATLLGGWGCRVATAASQAEALAAGGARRPAARPRAGRPASRRRARRSGGRRRAAPHLGTRRAGGPGHGRPRSDAAGAGAGAPGRAAAQAGEARVAARAAAAAPPIAGRLTA